MAEKKIPRSERRKILAARQERKRAERQLAGNPKLTRRARRQLATKS